MASSSRTRSTGALHYRSSTFCARASSPTRVSMHGPSPSVRFSTPPGRSISVSRKKVCTCSPTNHPGSFRCALHRGSNGHNHRAGVSYQSRSLSFRRSAMNNSLVRIGGHLVKRALAALIRPSSHQQRRRASFQPLPNRLSVVSKADDF